MATQVEENKGTGMNSNEVGSEADLRAKLLEVLSSVSSRGATFACGGETSTFPKFGGG